MVGSMQDKVKALQPYFKGMEMSESKEGGLLTYIKVLFPPEWIVDESTTERFGVEVAENEGILYFWSEGTNTDTIFDAVEFNIKQNKTAEEKTKIYKQKVAELKAVFADENNSVEALRSLSFVMNFAANTETISSISTKEGDETKITPKQLMKSKIKKSNKEAKENEPVAD